MRFPRRLIVLVASVVLVLVAVAGFLAREDEGLPGDLPAVPTPPEARSDRERTPLPDPFAYDPERAEEFERRAAAGTSHVLYARSPGGAWRERRSGSRAGARRSRRPRRRPTSTPTGSRRSCSSRARAARTRWRAARRAPSA